MTLFTTKTISIFAYVINVARDHFTGSTLKFNAKMAVLETNKYYSKFAPTRPTSIVNRVRLCYLTLLKV